MANQLVLEAATAHVFHSLVGAHGNVLWLTEGCYEYGGKRKWELIWGKLSGVLVVVVCGGFGSGTCCREAKERGFEALYTTFEEFTLEESVLAVSTYTPGLDLVTCVAVLSTCLLLEETLKVKRSITGSECFLNVSQR